MAFDTRRIAQLPLAFWCALFFGLACGILTAAAPQWQLERGVSLLGIDQVVSAAEPPLGYKARLLLAIIAMVAVAGAILLPYVAFRLIKPRRSPRPFAPTSTAPATVPLKREPALDVVTEPASRRPIFADKELGAPLLSEAALSRASVFDAAPVAPQVEPLAAATQVHEDPVYVAPEPLMSEPSAPPVEAPKLAVTAPTAPMPSTQPLDAMIARLERGLAQRGAGMTPPEPPAAAAQPMSQAASAGAPVAKPLSAVPTSDWGDAPAQGHSDALLHEAMDQLSRLASNQR